MFPPSPTKRLFEGVPFGHRIGPGLCRAGLLLLAAATLFRPAVAAEEHAAIQRRLAEATQYLASEPLQGRGVGTKGLDLAADFIATKFAEAGLKTDLFDGRPFQKFDVSLGSQLGKDNRLTLVGPPPHDGDKPTQIVLQLGKDFNPIAISGSAVLDAPLAFAGYGISAEKEHYDDYAGLDVKGKLVIVLRHEPQQDDAKSVFAGKRDSVYAPLRHKVVTARQHGAAGVIFCSDDFDIRKNVAADRKLWQQSLDRLVEAHEAFKKIADPSRQQLAEQRDKIDKLLQVIETLSKRLADDTDPVLSLDYGGMGAVEANFPVLHCRRTVIEKIVQAGLGTDLAALETQIDEGPTPHSGELKGWRAVGRVAVQQRKLDVKNVVAVLEGHGPHAEETIVVGAHYDHLGMGEHGSLAGTRAAHPGADDNASGVSVLLEVARALALRPEKLPRRVVFVAFTAEESGLLGSHYYVEHPLVPLDKTIAMVNLDMVGRLRDQRLMVLGVATAKLFDEILAKVPTDGLQLQKLPVGAGPSDQLSFYVRGIPVLHFFTGTHADYHRPSDTADKLNLVGMRQIAQIAEETVAALAAAPERPAFVATPSGAGMRFGGNRPVFGAMPEMADSADGMHVAAVLDGGPAGKAGLKAGDVVVEFGGQKIANLPEFLAALTKHKAGDKVKTVVRRGEQTLSFDVTLDKPQ